MAGSQIEKWKRKGGAKRRNESNATAIAKLVQRQLQLTPPSLPQALTVRSIRVEDGIDEAFFDDLEPDQGYVVNPTGVAEGDVLVAVPGEDGEPPTWTPAAPPSLVPLSDGNPPSGSPTPVVTGGPRWLAVNWEGISNADAVTYEVHLSTSSGFTPDSSTLAAEIRGTLVFLRLDADGDALEYDTDYYVKIVAKDVDGSAAASSEATDRLDPNATDDIVAGSIVAEHLESVMVLTNQIIAGDPGGQHLSFDPVEGFCLFGPDGTTKLVHLPTDDSEMPMFAGTIMAHGLEIDAGDGSIAYDNELGFYTTTGTRELVGEFSASYHTALFDGTRWSTISIRANDRASYAGTFSRLDLVASEGGSAGPSMARAVVAGASPSAGRVIIDSDSTSDFVQMHSQGIWRMEVVSASVNLPSTAAHTGGQMNVTISGLAVGDLVFYIGEESGAGGRAFHKHTNTVCASANTAVLNYYNADSSVGDPAAKLYYFLVIHTSV